MGATSSYVLQVKKSKGMNYINRRLVFLLFKYSIKHTEFKLD